MAKVFFSKEHLNKADVAILYLIEHLLLAQQFLSIPWRCEVVDLERIHHVIFGARHEVYAFAEQLYRHAETANYINFSVFFSLSIVHFFQNFERIVVSEGKSSGTGWILESIREENSIFSFL